MKEKLILIGCKVHPKMRHEFKRLARLEDRTVSQQLRRLVGQYLRQAHQAQDSHPAEEDYGCEQGSADV